MSIPSMGSLKCQHRFGSHLYPIFNTIRVPLVIFINIFIPQKDGKGYLEHVPWTSLIFLMRPPFYANVLLFLQYLSTS